MHHQDSVVHKSVQNEKKQTAVPDKKKQEKVPYAESIQCVRMSSRNKMCAKVRSAANTEEPKEVQYAIADSIHKMLLVVVPKAGSYSWRLYFQKFVPEVDGDVTIKKRKYKKYGLSFKQSLSTGQINNGYKDYLKFVMVRHPLQRFVSGYFEVIVERRKYSDLWCKTIHRALRNDTSCDPKHTLTLSEFTRGFSLGLLPENEHWRSQQLASLPCDVHLDMIFKVETSLSDMKVLNEKLGMQTGSLLYINKSKSGPHASSPKHLLTNYDTRLRTLQEEAPEAFKWLLGYFQTDMKMFGYTWDSNLAKSGCSYSGITESNIC